MSHPLVDLGKADSLFHAAKEGWKTTEFLIALLLISAGLILCYTGHIEQGSKVIGYVGAGYIAARTITKATLPFKTKSSYRENTECKDKLL
jgi:hypothetical protein